ncbi:MAG: efflux RND transporter periplasmic adaptor subunit [Bryobacteraceae bacterium]
MKKLAVLLLVVATAVIAWGILRKSRPPTVGFARVQRQTLVSTLPTNGKVEPYQWQPVRAETAGLLSRLAVHEGELVAQGAVLAEISDPTRAADLEAAQARVDEARARLASLEQGGRPAELTEIDNSLARARFDLEKEQKDYEALKRLQDHEAATAHEVEDQADKVRQSHIEIDGLEKRRKALVGATDVDAARARLADVQAALDAVRAHAAAAVLRAPLAGQVYGLLLRQGAYLAAGDLLANVGRLDRVRVWLYVDEPLLGRVAPGQPVTITWEALPGRQWRGAVEKMPADIRPLGSRQVGDVVSVIDNPGRELLPGTNVDAEIRTGVADGALVIPKEALHHDAAGDWVFRLEGDHVERRVVKTGNSTVTQVQVTAGLAEGDAVAMPTDVPLADGAKVTPGI